MFRKWMIVSLLLIALLFVAQIAFAQDGTLPSPVPYVDEIGALLVRLGAFAAMASIALVHLKPIFLNQWSETLDPNLYLVIIYLIRLIGGGITLLMFGGVAVLYQVAPSLETLPLPEETRGLVVFVGAVVLLSLGQEGIYVVLNILRALAGLPPVGSVPDEEEEPA